MASTLSHQRAEGPGSSAARGIGTEWVRTSEQLGIGDGAEHPNYRKRLIPQDGASNPHLPCFGLEPNSSPASPSLLMEPLGKGGAWVAQLRAGEISLSSAIPHHCLCPAHGLTLPPGSAQARSGGSAYVAHAGPAAGRLLLVRSLPPAPRPATPALGPHSLPEKCHRPWEW